MNIKQTLAATVVLSRAARTGPVMAGLAENVQTVRDFYQLLEEKDVARWAHLLAEDAVQDMPYSPSNFIPRVETREAIHKHFSGFPDGTSDVRLEILSIHPSTDEKIVLAEIDGMIEFKGVEKP